MYSGLPDNSTLDYCDTVNNTLQLEGNFKLKLDDIINDAARRKYYKLLSCSIFGKIGQSNIFPEDYYVQNPSQLEDLLDSWKGIVSHIELINSEVLYCRFEPAKAKLGINRSGNCAIAALITAFARIKMHKAVISLVNQDDIKLYSVEADAIAFSKKVGTSLTIKIGNQTGNFKEEYCGILHFSSLGSKTSCVLYLEDSDIQSSVKVKGLNLKGKQAANIINP